MGVEVRGQSPQERGGPLRPAVIQAPGRQHGRPLVRAGDSSVCCVGSEWVGQWDTSCPADKPVYFSRAVKVWTSKKR